MSVDQPMLDDNAWTRGETVEMRLVLTDSDGSTFDLSTLNAIEYELKRSPGDADPPLLHLEIGDGITLLTQTGEDLGACNVVVTDAQTLSVPPGMYHFDIFATKPDGSRRCAIGPSVQRVNDPVNFP